MHKEQEEAAFGLGLVCRPPFEGAALCNAKIIAYHTLCIKERSLGHLSYCI